MDVLFVGFIMSLSITTLMMGISSTTMRRIMGYKKLFNLVLHFSAIALFIGTSAEALIAAECAAIFLSFWVWLYSLLFGYSRREVIPQTVEERTLVRAARKGVKATVAVSTRQIKPRFWHPHKWVEYPGVLSKWFT